MDTRSHRRLDRLVIASAMHRIKCRDRPDPRSHVAGALNRCGSREKGTKAVALVAGGSPIRPSAISRAPARIAVSRSRSSNSTLKAAVAKYSAIAVASHAPFAPHQRVLSAGVGQPPRRADAVRPPKVC